MSPKPINITQNEASHFLSKCHLYKSNVYQMPGQIPILASHQSKTCFDQNDGNKNHFDQMSSEEVASLLKDKTPNHFDQLTLG